MVTKASLATASILLAFSLPAIAEIDIHNMRACPPPPELKMVRSQSQSSFCPHLTIECEVAWEKHVRDVDKYNAWIGRCTPQTQPIRQLPAAPAPIRQHEAGSQPHKETYEEWIAANQARNDALLLRQLETLWCRGRHGDFESDARKICAASRAGDLALANQYVYAVARKLQEGQQTQTDSTPSGGGEDEGGAAAAAAINGFAQGFGAGAAAYTHSYVPPRPTYRPAPRYNNGGGGDTCAPGGYGACAAR